MRLKLWPWVIVVALSTVMPFTHFLFTHRLIQPYTTYWLVDLVIFTAAIYWWYLLDKRQRNFPAGGTQNISVIFLTVIGLPVYFIRSRGWRKGAIATIVGLLVFIGLSLLSYGSELLGKTIAL